nr:spindle pole body-associated protein [Ipomoea batatas]
MTLVGVSHSLSFFPLPPFHPSPPQNLCFQGHQFSSISAFAPTLALITNDSRSKPIASWSCRSKQNDLREVAFFDENGAVKDMDAYLNNLSLEYDSVWDTKPSWCQPWTIALTGIVAIAASWLILQSLALTAVVVALISAWWYIFLYSYPKAYAEMIAERRERVTNGLEDTYGEEKNQ